MLSHCRTPLSPTRTLQSVRVHASRPATRLVHLAQRLQCDGTNAQEFSGKINMLGS